MNRRILFIYLLFCFLCQNEIWAQTELNVKLSPGNTPLSQILSQISEGVENFDPSNEYINNYPFLTTTQAVKKLVNSENIAELDQWYTIQFPGDARGRFAELQNSGLFLAVELNRTVSLHADQASMFVPNDDSLANQWYHDFIESFAAWDITQGSADIRIGVIDTGLDYLHPEFDGQLAINRLEDLNGNGRFDPWPATEIRNGISGDFNGLDEDNNGYPDDVIGYDFTDQPRSPFGGDYLFEDPDPWDDNDHGTVVSGIISAKSDNQIGGAGLAPGCKLSVIRAFSSTGAGEDDDIARAIIYAADNGIQILNFSFGDIYPSLMMHDAIKYAYAKGVIMVSSAGNGTGDALHYPSGFNEVISVSASAADLATGDEFLWPLSSYGVTVDLCAPGSGIFTTAPLDTANNGQITAYGRFNGTSASAPMVASAVALIFSENGVLSPQQVRGILTS
ncbi:MAG: S8 family serine peptidase, partial [Bacteroidota bacterium]